MSDKLLDPLCAAGAPAGLPVLLLAAASAFSVANVYYAQPLLDAIAHDFSISGGGRHGDQRDSVGLRAGAAVGGAAGDRLNRHRLLAGQQLGLIGALLLVGWAHSALWLLVGMLLVGLLGTAMTQGLIAYAAAGGAGARAGGWCGAGRSGAGIAAGAHPVRRAGGHRGLAHGVFLLCRSDAGIAADPVAPATCAAHRSQYAELSRAAAFDAEPVAA